MSRGPIVRLEGVTKRYAGIAVLEDANFELYPGEIHALVGENGAGKSTLCKVIAGVIMPSEGRLFIDGQEVHLTAPKDAAPYGISMVYQESSLVPQLTAAQNMVLGRERVLNSVRGVRNAARQVLQRLNFNVEPSQLAGSLSAAKRQMVEIARAVLNDARIIILDEPTATLTPEEANHLFEFMRTLQKAGVAMIFISHALEEALIYADRITVLRNGRLMKTGPASEFDRDSLIRHMIGDELKARQPAPRGPARPAPRFPFFGWTTSAWGASSTTCRFRFFRGDHRDRRTDRLGAKRSRQSHHGAHQAQLRRRQDLVGRPRGPLSRALSGGGGRDCLCHRGSQTRRPLRHDAGKRECRTWMAGEIRATRRCRAVSKMRAVSREWEERLSIRRVGNDQSVLYLSGGNQQKVVFAKSLAQKPKLVIFDEPTRGVDVGAIAEIRQIIRAFADSGAGVMLISSYLPEILDLSDRILVAKGGAIAAEFSRSEATAEKILDAAIR